MSPQSGRHTPSAVAFPFSETQVGDFLFLVIGDADDDGPCRMRITVPSGRDGLRIEGVHAFFGLANYQKREGEEEEQVFEHDARLLIFNR